MHLLYVLYVYVCYYVMYIILDCSISVVKDVVFVVDTYTRIGFSTFQLIRELIENITIDIALDSPKTLFGLITFDDFARLEFNVTRHTNLDTLLPAINPGLRYYRGFFGSNTASALNLLLEGSVDGGLLQLRNNTSKVAIVITSGYYTSLLSLQSAANSLHAANVFDVYAVGISDRAYSQLQLIASDPSFVFSTSTLTSFTAQKLQTDVVERLCSSK